MDAYSISLENENKISALDKGLSKGITDTYIEEVDVLKDIIQKKKIVKKKRTRLDKENAYLETPAIQLT